MYCILGICLIADCYVVMGYLRYVSYPDMPRNSYYMTDILPSNANWEEDDSIIYVHLCDLLVLSRRHDPGSPSLLGVGWCSYMHQRRWRMRFLKINMIQLEWTCSILKNRLGHTLDYKYEMWLVHRSLGDPWAVICHHCFWAESQFCYTHCHVGIQLEQNWYLQDISKWSVEPLITFHMYLSHQFVLSFF